MADDESRGVHLSDKQLVFVFMSATVAPWSCSCSACSSGAGRTGPGCRLVTPA